MNFSAPPGRAVAIASPSYLPAARTESIASQAESYEEEEDGDFFGSRPGYAAVYACSNAVVTGFTGGVAKKPVNCVSRRNWTTCGTADSFKNALRLALSAPHQRTPRRFAWGRASSPRST